MNGIQNPRSTDKESEIQSIPLSNAVIRNPQRGIQNLRLLGFTYIGRRSDSKCALCTKAQEALTHEN